MAHQDLNKFYPASSEEMAKMLGLTGTVAPVNIPAAPSGQVVQDEIVPVEAVVKLETPKLTTHEETIARDVEAITGKKRVAENIPNLNRAQKPALKAVTTTLIALIPYVLVFAVGVFVYYAWFADPSNRPQIFSSFQRKTDTTTEDRNKLFTELKKDEQASYTKWIASFYYNVSDASLVSMDFIAPNKLTNFENYLLKLNPTTNDVRGTGTSDADSVLQGIDPITGRTLTDAQRDIVAQYFDGNAIHQRVAGAATTPRTIVTPRVAQAQTQTSPSPSSGSLAPIKPGPTTNDCAENRLKINTAIPGRLEVPAMAVNVPIIWTKDAKNFDEDLKSGVVHYPCTPLPGDIGTSYISGHSSNYAWVKADFNKIFAKMNDLPDGATFKVTVVGLDGKDIRLHYIVQHKQVFAANDQAQFVNTADSIVALSTCWPLNTTEKRMVAFGKLDRVEW